MTGEIVIRPYRTGEPSLVCHLQMALYQRQYGFKGIFEYYLLQGMSAFLHCPEGGQLWVVEQQGTLVGSIAIVQNGPDSAQLRWFAVEDALQGQGIGGQLMDRALQFCADSGYTKVILWTADILHAARHLYQKYGFTLVETKENTEWTDRLLLEEKWERSL
ncbi:MAG: GNAT family N-acetyltransferase [Clostridiales bacterium]|nr:GNAT family N-acetyltransferase [Clostridiales bacterium]